ncbi:unnamed protein product [Parnassius apollo]|uniref:(apollo) hypothetical protein n=1 Tax=Parnassius apollo TaxID=110799 RepID=A0A8S3XJV6_PARAO|nr:unnamed protein product [Parnassius apollo]
MDSFTSLDLLRPQEPERLRMGSVSDMLLTKPIPETSYEAPSISNIFSNHQEESIPGSSNDTPSASDERSSRQMRRIRNSFEESLQDQPQ